MVDSRGVVSTQARPWLLHVGAHDRSARACVVVDVAAQVLAAFEDYATYGATCGLGQQFHSITLNLLLPRIDAIRQVIADGMASTPGGQRIQAAAAVAAREGRLPNATEEDRSGRSIIRQLADGTAFAGMLGTTHLATHALARLWSDPEVYLPMCVSRRPGSVARCAKTVGCSLCEEGWVLGLWGNAWVVARGGERVVRAACSVEWQARTRRSAAFLRPHFIPCLFLHVVFHFSLCAPLPVFACFNSFHYRLCVVVGPANAIRYDANPRAFLHEEARVDPPVTSITALLEKDQMVHLAGAGQVWFPSGTPYQVRWCHGLALRTHSVVSPVLPFRRALSCQYA
jgi:hypothetical protein